MFPPQKLMAKAIEAKKTDNNNNNTPRRAPYSETSRESAIISVLSSRVFCQPALRDLNCDSRPATVAFADSVDKFDQEGT